MMVAILADTGPFFFEEGLRLYDGSTRVPAYIGEPRYGVGSGSPVVCESSKGTLSSRMA